MKAILILIISTFSLFSQNYFELTNKRDFNAWIIENEPDSLKIEMFDSRILKIPKDRIANSKIYYSKLKFMDGREFCLHIYRISKDTIFTRDSIGKKNSFARNELLFLPKNDLLTLDEVKGGGTSDEHYTQFGVTLGTPSSFNAVLGYHFSESNGVRVHFGFLPMYTGINLQIDFMFNLKKMKNFEHNLSIVGGLIEPTYSDPLFVGAAYDLNIYGFHFQAGLAYTQSIEYPFQLYINIGYVFRFNK